MDYNDDDVIVGDYTAGYTQQLHQQPTASTSTSNKGSSNGPAKASGSKKNTSKAAAKQSQSSSQSQQSAVAAASSAANQAAADDEDKKKRSSKACDACRKAKCKCTRNTNPDGTEDPQCMNCKANSIDCTFLGASKKRGPPKGYIEAIENRMHRMEALLGGLLNNDDPRAQALLEDLVGDIEARELLSRDLLVATKTGRDNAPVLKSWQRATSSAAGVASSGGGSAAKQEEYDLPGLTNNGKGKTPITQRGFALPGFGGNSGSQDQSTAGAFANMGGGVGQRPSRLSDEDLIDGSGGLGQGSNNYGMDFSTSTGNFSTDGTTISGSMNALQIPGPSSSTAGSQPLSTSPRHQRRRLEHTTSDSTKDEAANKRSNLFFQQKQRSATLAAPATIPHTGTAYYNLSAGLLSPNNNNISTMPDLNTADSPSTTISARSPDGMTEGVSPPLLSTSLQNTQQQQQQQQQANNQSNQSQDGPMSELADVVGQLSLDENREVRYHGRSSGLYLISKSARYQDFFWRFPRAGVWPPAADESNFHKTEEEMCAKLNVNSVLPDKRMSDHLLELYWIFVHPHIPLLYRSLFVRQYRNTVHAGGADNAQDGTTTSTTPGSADSASAITSNGKPAPAQAVGGKVPAVLLLAVYAVAARYSDSGGPRIEGQYWTAGDEYASKAKELIHEDFGSSRLTTIQAMLLLAYREIGCGAMAQSWTFVGMAVRMAQDMGLFRDVDKWFLPVNAFGYEEKQTRKRVWWTAIVLDKYVSAYIGRPMAIFERDYDVALPAEDEPDEHDIWRPIRPDGTDWSESPIMDTSDNPVLAQVRNYPQGIKSNSISCFNHSASLSVLFSRIIANLYAIRVRVLGQNSESLLAHLDQALANWYINLPPHLRYNSASRRVPPPHVLALHCQFFAALILLHRPFIPAPGQDKTKTAFPSHSICTTGATAITNIIAVYSKTYTLRQSIPMLTYYIFSASIMHVYNSTYDEALAPSAKIHLVKCMKALQEMHVTWASASRQCELLLGIVDLRDVDASESRSNSRMNNDESQQSRKRQAETQEVDSRSGSGNATPSASFYQLPDNRRTASSTSASGASGAGSSQNRSSSQSGYGAKPKRSAGMNVRSRHNSVTAAGLRKDGSTPDSRIAASAFQAPPGASASSGHGLSTSVPLADFTFQSPSAHFMGLPSTAEIPTTSSMFNTSSIFDLSQGFQTGTSPSFPSINIGNLPTPSTFTTSLPQASHISAFAQEPHHSFDILNLSSGLFGGESNDQDMAPSASAQQNNFFSQDDGSTASQDLFASMGLPSPPAPSNTNNTTGSTYTNLSDFLMDPFWQNLQAQQDAGHAARLAGAESEMNSAGMSDMNSGMDFSNMQSNAFFSLSPLGEPSPDSWSAFQGQNMNMMQDPPESQQQ